MKLAQILGSVLKVLMFRGRSWRGSFTKEHYPIRISSLLSDEFGARWFTRVLRHAGTIAVGDSVQSIEPKRNIPYGQLSDKHSVRMTLSTGEVLDAFVKFNLEGPLVKRVFTDVILGAPRAESVFYSSVAPVLEKECGLRFPRCYFVEWNARSNEFVLVLEDLNFGDKGLRPFVYRTSSQWNEELRLMLTAAATINGHFWGGEHACLSAVPRMQARPWLVLAMLGKAAWPNVANKRLKGKATEAAPLLVYPTPSAEVRQLALDLLAVAPKLCAWLARADSGLHTMCYHDACLDNTFFVESGESAPLQCGIFDFQFACVGNIGIEWAWTMSLLPVDLVVQHEAEIIDLVLATIEAKAGTKIDRELFMDAYALGWVFPLMTHSTGVDALMDDLTPEELLSCSDDGSPRSNNMLVLMHGVHNVILALERHNVRERLDRWRASGIQ